MKDGEDPRDWKIAQLERERNALLNNFHFWRACAIVMAALWVLRWIFADG